MVAGLYQVTLIQQNVMKQRKYFQLQFRFKMKRSFRISKEYIIPMEPVENIRSHIWSGFALYFERMRNELSFYIIK